MLFHLWLNGLNFEELKVAESIIKKGSFFEERILAELRSRD